MLSGNYNCKIVDFFKLDKMSLWLMEFISYIKLKATLNILFPPLKNKTKNPGVLGGGNG